MAEEKQVELIALSPVEHDGKLIAKDEKFKVPQSQAPALINVSAARPATKDDDPATAEEAKAAAKTVLDEANTKAAKIVADAKEQAEQIKATAEEDAAKARAEAQGDVANHTDEGETQTDQKTGQTNLKAVPKKN